MKQENRSTAYPNIDMIETGKKLRRVAKRAGYSVRVIQEYLHLSCPQPIYRWFNGQVLPTVDHLYMLSVLFGVHMEELLVPTQKPLQFGVEVNIFTRADKNARLQKYVTVFNKKVA